METVGRCNCLSNPEMYLYIYIYIYIYIYRERERERERLHVVQNQQSYKINKIPRIVQRTPQKKVIKRLVQ